MILGKEKLINIFGDKYGEDYTSNGIDFRLQSVEILAEEKNNIPRGIYNGSKYLPTYQDFFPDNNGIYHFKTGKYYYLNLGQHFIPENTISLYFLRSTIMRCGGVLNSSVADRGYNGTIKVGFFCYHDISIGQNERIVQAIYLETQKGENYNGTYQENTLYIDDDIKFSDITIFGKPFLRDDGYYVIGNKKNLLHRLIYEYYYGEIENGYVVHHKNGNKTDNRIQNLELVSRKAHINHHREELYKNQQRIDKNQYLPNNIYKKGHSFVFEHTINNNKTVIHNRHLDDLYKDIVDYCVQNNLNELKNKIQNSLECVENIRFLHYITQEKGFKPYGCSIGTQKQYRFMQPAHMNDGQRIFLGSSTDFSKAIDKAIKKTTCQRYSDYLKWWKYKYLSKNGDLDD